MCYIRFENSNSKVIKDQRGHHMLCYAVSQVIATITLKITQFRIDNKKADIAQCYNIRRQYKRSVARTREGKFNILYFCLLDFLDNYP